ncbi:centrosomal protein of 170 kDa protein B [Pholidichthys leucotaenia]
MSVTSWFLVSSSGMRHRLPREMIFVGREDCELMLQSRSVDKQHAVINYNLNTDEHMVKDLGSLNGTFVNDLRIPDQTYITLKLSDVIRFGYDAHVYILEKSQHKVPEEALKHEKYTSQLQLSIKALEAKAKEKLHFQNSEKCKDSNAKTQDRTERKAHSLTAATDSPISKPTPLYGQPSWWGEDEDPANKKQNKEGKLPSRETPESPKDVSRYEVNGSLSDSQAKSILFYRREPSYFEIPTKELQERSPKKPELQVHEVPTKDTSDPTQCLPSNPTPPVVQSHASFTIEFDECTPGKMKIKDHVTKFSFRQQRKQLPAEVVTTPTEVMSAESKVADWLVHSNAGMTRSESPDEDMYSTNSDPTLLKSAKVSLHEDGMQSDSGHPPINGNDFLQSDTQAVSLDSPQILRASPPEQCSSSKLEDPSSHASLSKAESRQAFVIEFFDNSRKKCSQSFTNNATPPEPSGFAPEKTKNNLSPTVERQITPSPTTNIPATQRYTIPLKDPAPTGPQRAGSLRREKTEERLSTSFSSRSSSSISMRPFSSVGRKSKLTQEFTAELLKQAKQEKNAKASKMVTSQSDQRSSSPPQLDGHYQPQTSSPVHKPVPLKAPVMPMTFQNVEVKSPPGVPRNDEDDSLSDAGTYTIETDVQDKELDEARNKIDQVFGVVEKPERSNLSEAETSSAFRPVIVQGSEQHRQSSCREDQPAGAALPGAPKWMSCWASLADSYTESGPSSGRYDITSQMELSEGARGMISRNHDSTQAQMGKRSDTTTPSIHVHYDPHSTFDVGDNSLPVSQDSSHRLTVQDDVEPDSLSDASKSDDGSIIEQKRRPLSDGEEKHNEGKPRIPSKATSFYIGSEEESVSKPDCTGLKPVTPKPERKHVSKAFSTATLIKHRGNQDSGKVKLAGSAPVRIQGSQRSEGKEGGASPLIRQESFTKERPSSSRLPNISSQPALRDIDAELLQGAKSQDTHSFLKDTEVVLAALEARLQVLQPASTPSPIMDSLSGESDVDTSSTLSQHSNKIKPITLTETNSAGGLNRERSAAGLASQDSNCQSIWSEKRCSQEAERSTKAELFRRPVGLRRSVRKRGSTDLSDDHQSLPYSDQESNGQQMHKKYTIPLQKEDAKSSRVSQALSRANSLSAPRPTRTSMLRRARLGEASDNEGTETDRLSQEAGNTLAKQPQEAKKLSRLDMLAMPRKRTSSFTTPSDTEASSAPQWTGRGTGFSNRSTEMGGSSTRRASGPGSKPVERPQKVTLNRTPVTRLRSSSAKYASSTASSRRRQKGSDYASTSDEEYDLIQSTPKHKRCQTSSGSHSTRSQTRAKPIVALHPKLRHRDSEEETHEGEAFQNWSTHSAEIARLSEDLAKDLAILAREIHDVAGDVDQKNPEGESGAPTSALIAHEQLVHHIPQAELNHQRVPPSSGPMREPDQNSSDHEQSSRKQAQHKEEIVVDTVMLNPMSQVTMAIRDNTEQLAEKIKVLFQDRMDVWEEIEAKANSDNEAPFLNSSNKEVTSILKELRRIQRQLEIINSVMEPSWQPGAAKATVGSSWSESRASRVSSSRDWRTVHSISKRGGGPRPSESVRRAAVTPDDRREGHLV